MVIGSCAGSCRQPSGLQDGWDRPQGHDGRVTSWPRSAAAGRASGRCAVHGGPGSVPAHASAARSRRHLLPRLLRRADLDDLARRAAGQRGARHAGHPRQGDHRRRADQGDRLPGPGLAAGLAGRADPVLQDPPGAGTRPHTARSPSRPMLAAATPHSGTPGPSTDIEVVPDELSPQVPILLDVLAAIGIATAGAPGFEADDVIGTLAAAEINGPGRGGHRRPGPVPGRPGHRPARGGPVHRGRA